MRDLIKIWCNQREEEAANYSFHLVIYLNHPFYLLVMLQCTMYKFTYIYLYKRQRFSTFTVILLSILLFNNTITNNKQVYLTIILLHYNIIKGNMGKRGQ